MNLELLTNLVIFNTIVNLLAIFAVAYKSYFNRFELRWMQTFWCKRKYGVELYLWQYPCRETPNNGNRIFFIQFMTEEKASKNDYKNYLEKKYLKKKVVNKNE